MEPAVLTELSWFRSWPRFYSCGRNPRPDAAPPFTVEFTPRFLVREAGEMSLPQTNSFDAHLPGVSQSVRIASFHDAKVFVCRWTIRDKDPSLKALLRHMEQARSSATADSAIWQLKQMLTSRGMLVTPRP
jgi:hypothetical protein